MSNREMTRVLICSEHLVFLEGLGEILRRNPAIELVGQAPSLSEAVLTALHRHPDVILLDVAAVTHGTLDAIRLMKEDHKEARIFVLSASGGSRDVSHAITTGASGYLPDDIGPEELFEVLLAERPERQRDSTPPPTKRSAQAKRGSARRRRPVRSAAA